MRNMALVKSGPPRSVLVAKSVMKLELAGWVATASPPPDPLLTTKGM